MWSLYGLNSVLLIDGEAIQPIALATILAGRRRRRASLHF